VTASANPEQYESWNGDQGRRWIGTADERDAMLAPFADALLEHAAVARGEHVLDVGCGCGATTITAARSAGADGAATGVDFAETMLGVARDRCRAASCENVTFVQADAQVDALGGPFDVAISRFGTMFFADTVAAFTNVAQHLRPGGRVCIATWQPLVANEWLIVPAVVLLEFGKMPEDIGPGMPGMFAQSEAETIESILGAAGFADVDVTPVTRPMTIGATVDDAAAYLASSGPGRAILETVPADRHDEARAAVAEALVEHHAPGTGVVLDGGVLITTATLR
jgi:ubiquinone/menaquinone biosynthesis C-methylase UbiE